MTVGYTKGTNTVTLTKRRNGIWDVAVYHFLADGTEVVNFIEPFRDEKHAMERAQHFCDGEVTVRYLDRADQKG